MPDLLERPAETDAQDNPFADLIPPAEDGGPAYQVIGGRFGEVPKAEIAAPAEIGSHALYQPTSFEVTGLEGNDPNIGAQLARIRSSPGEYGDFADLVPQSPTPETEKAVADSEPPKPAGPLDGVDTGLMHQALNSVRVFGTAAGKYIFRGLQGLRQEQAKLLANPTPEMVASQPEAVLLPKDQQDALEAQYVAETQAGVPDAVAKAEYWKHRAATADAESNVDPGLEHTIPARLSAAAGEATAMGMESLVPGAGLPLMTLHGALATEAEAKNNGATDEQAEQAAVRSAIGLGIFGGASKVAALGVAKLLPSVVSDPSKLVNFIAQFAGQEGANELSTRAISAWNAAAEAPDGDKVNAAVKAMGQGNMEASTLNAVYALMHASKMAGAKEAGLSEKDTSISDNPEAPVSPASASEPVPATTTGAPAEMARSVEPAPEAAAPVMQPVETTATPEVNDWTQATAPEATVAPTAAEPAVAPEPAAVKAIIPDYGPKNVVAEIDTAAMQKLLTQAMEMTGERTKSVNLWLDKKGNIGVTSHTPDMGEFAGGPADPATAKFLSAYDPQFLLDGIRAARALGHEKVSLSLDTKEREMSPGVLSAKGMKYVLMPMRMESGSVHPLAEVAKPVKAKTPKPEPEPSSAAMGIVPPGTAELHAAAEAIGGTAKALAKGATSLKPFHDFRRARLKWSARNQAAGGESTMAAKAIEKAIPSPVRRAAITNWIQAKGDATELRNRAMATNNLNLRRGYEAALTLTPEELAVAGKVRQTYDILRKRAVANGIEIGELDNYVNQLWNRSVLKDFGTTFGGRKLNASVRYAKQRFHESFFHGEQAGLTPETKDIGKLLPIYMAEVNKAISDKQFVADMAKGKASDGRLLLAPRGGGKVIEGTTPEEKGSVLVFPDRASEDTADYKSLDQPALHAWKWAASDENGRPTLVKGDLAVHPEAATHLKNILGQSALREWWNSPSESTALNLGKGAAKFLVDDVQQVGKATMLGFVSPFHQIQEGTHAIGHKVNPFGGLEKIDMRKPNQMDAAEHGLMLLPDRVSAQQFREGLDGSRRNLLTNVLGKVGGKAGKAIQNWSDTYQDYLFKQYIPSLKLKTYEHILDRNTKRFANELATGKATIEQVKFLTAEQTNAAYGHLNYTDMGRNPTLQHVMQTLLLAPDFLEARARFAGQAVKGIASKTGREQLAALATLAGTQYVLARVLNKTLDDDYHWDEPFGVVVGGRRYTMRSVPEDIYKAFQDWRKFAGGRLSPLIGRGLLEGLSGINYRNEPTTLGETFTNIIAGMVPLTLQPATRGLSETGRDNPVSPFEQLLGSLGLHVSRFSPTAKVYQLSKSWVEEHGKEFGIAPTKGLYPPSKYQQMRYALEDGDLERAKSEYDKLIEAGEKKAKIGDGFRESILHSFTGSVAGDLKFKKSLSGDDRKMYDAAVKRRHEILKRFQAMKTRGA